MLGVDETCAFAFLTSIVSSDVAPVVRTREWGRRAIRRSPAELAEVAKRIGHLDRNLKLQFKRQVRLLYKRARLQRLLAANRGQEASAF